MEGEFDQNTLNVYIKFSNNKKKIYPFQIASLSPFKFVLEVLCLFLVIIHGLSAAPVSGGHFPSQPPPHLVNEVR